jgi:hypothetical protein
MIIGDTFIGHPLLYTVIAPLKRNFVILPMLLQKTWWIALK